MCMADAREGMHEKIGNARACVCREMGGGDGTCDGMGGMNGGVARVCVSRVFVRARVCGYHYPRIEQRTLQDARR